MPNVDERHPGQTSGSWEELEVGQRGCDKSWKFHLNVVDHRL